MHGSILRGVYKTASARVVSTATAEPQLDPSFLRILRNQLGRKNYQYNSPWIQHGDDLDLIESIMEYEEANNGDVDDRKTYDRWVGPRDAKTGFRDLLPTVTLGQVSDGLRQHLKMRSPSLGPIGPASPVG